MREPQTSTEFQDALRRLEDDLAEDNIDPTHNAVAIRAGFLRNIIAALRSADMAAETWSARAVDAEARIDELRRFVDGVMESARR